MTATNTAPEVEKVQAADTQKDINFTSKQSGKEAREAAAALAAERMETYPEQNKNVSEMLEQTLRDQISRQNEGTELLAGLAATGARVDGATATGAAVETKAAAEAHTAAAPEKSLSADELNELKREIEKGLETGILDWNVEEDRVINALMKVPSHQMDEFMSKFGGKKEFLDLIKDSNAFKTHESDLITAKVMGDTDLMASALEDVMVDNSFMDYADADSGVAMMQGLSKEELQKVLAKTDVEAIKKSIEVEFQGIRSKQVEAYAQLARGGVDTYKEMANDVGFIMRAGADITRKRVFESLKSVDMEKLLAADPKLKGQMLSLAQRSSAHRESVFNLLYGEERAKSLVAIGGALDKPENAKAFVEAYQGMSEEQKTQFKKDFAEIYGEKHGSNVDIALSKALSKDREAWVDTMNALDNGHSFKKDGVMALSEGDYQALVKETDELLKDAHEKSVYDSVSANEETEVKAEVESETEIEEKSEKKSKGGPEKESELSPAEENIVKYCKEYRMNPERVHDKVLKDLVVSYMDSVVNSNSENLDKMLGSLSNEQKDQLMARAATWAIKPGTTVKDQTIAEAQRRFKNAFISEIDKSKTSAAAAA